MKVLLLCMAFAAVSLAMPVAEEKIEEPLALPSVPEIKSEDVKSPSETLPAPAEEKKPELVPEIKSDKPEQPEAKSGNAPIDAAPEEKPEVKAEPIPDVKIEEAPKPKSSEKVETESKPEISKQVEPKPEETVVQPEPKSAVVEEPKQEEAPAKVEEIITPSAKSAIPDDVIDVVSAIKNPAAVADDVVDPAAINPISDPQPILSIKSATPEEKKVDTPVPESGLVKAIIEENKPVEKLEDKPAEVAATAEVPAAPKSVAVAEDTTRVIRDAIEEKKDADVKTITEAVKQEVKPVEVEPKSAKPVEDIQAAKEKQAEPAKVEQPIEVPKEVKSSELPKEKEVKLFMPFPLAADAVKEEKPQVKSEEAILNDAPAKDKDSDESAESSEKNVSSEDSSEESDEKSKDAPKP